MNYKEKITEIYDMIGKGRIMMKQVAVQKWEGDHIIHEKFYHK